MKLKKLLNENVWNNRKFGEPLPTLEDTTKAYKLKQEQEINEMRPDQDTDKVAKILGKSMNDVHKFVMKYGIEADDLLDVLDSGSSSQRRRYSMAILAAMKGNRRALKDLDNLLGFLNEEPIVENNAAIKKQSIQLLKDMVKFKGKLNQFQMADIKKLLALLKKIK